MTKSPYCVQMEFVTVTLQFVANLVLLRSWKKFVCCYIDFWSRGAKASTQSQCKDLGFWTAHLVTTLCSRGHVVGQRAGLSLTIPSQYLGALDIPYSTGMEEVLSLQPKVYEKHSVSLLPPYSPHFWALSLDFNIHIYSTKWSSVESCNRFMRHGLVPRLLYTRTTCVYSQHILSQNILNQLDRDVFV